MEAFSTQLCVALLSKTIPTTKWGNEFFHKSGFENYRYAAVKNEWEKPLKLCIFHHPKANIEAIFKASQKAKKIFCIQWR